jgi:hypothetical protein
MLLNVSNSFDENVNLLFAKEWGHSSQIYVVYTITLLLKEHERDFWT